MLICPDGMNIDPMDADLQHTCILYLARLSVSYYYRLLSRPAHVPCMRLNTFSRAARSDVMM